MRGAGLPARAGDDEHATVVALVGIGRARRHVRAHRVRGQERDPRAVDLRRSSRAGCRCPRSRALPSARRRAAAPAAVSARRASRSSSLESRVQSVLAGRPRGRSADRSTPRVSRPIHVFDDRCRQAGRAASRARCRTARPRSDRNRGRGRRSRPRAVIVDLGDLDAERARLVEVGARVVPHVGRAADEPDAGPSRHARAAAARRRTRRRRCCLCRTGPRRASPPGPGTRPPSRRRPARPALSIRTRDGMPISSMVRRSASRIWPLFRTRMTTAPASRMRSSVRRLAQSRGAHRITVAHS